MSLRGRCFRLRPFLGGQVFSFVWVWPLFFFLLFLEDVLFVWDPFTPGYFLFCFFGRCVFGGFVLS